jgi:protein-disulfide isomerase
MRARTFLACTLAVLALAGCNKKSEGGGTATSTDNSKVTITEAAPPPGGTWADVTNATSAGFLIGNPNAKVKLVEIGSLSCPVCKRFDDEGVQTLIEKYVKPGTVSWEFRPYIVHGPIDMALNLVARCNGAKTFLPFMEAAYNNQPVFTGKIEAAPQDKVAAIQNLPTNQVFVAMANLIGLQEWAAMRGMPQATSNQCLSDQKRIDQEVQFTSDVTSQYPDFKGTPSFVLNGKLLDDTVSWAQLQPQLDEAVK